MSASLSGKPATVRDLLQSGLRQLPETETARLDCEVLLSSALGEDRYYLYAHPDATVNERVIADFNLLLGNRSAGFPVAYLTGQKEFWSLQLAVSQDTLIPRPETELLVELALTMIPATGSFKILDLGTGSGAIAVALASERPDCRITATDISLAALAIAQQNAQRHGLNNIHFVHSDWFSAIRAQQYTLIVSNPPYVESDHSQFISGEIRHEPRIALDGGQHGLDAYRRIIPAATAFLSNGGRLLVEHGYTQGEPVRALFQHNHFLNISTRQDYAGLDRITLAELP